MISMSTVIFNIGIIFLFLNYFQCRIKIKKPYGKITIGKKTLDRIAALPR